MDIEAGNPDLNDDLLGSTAHPQIWYHLCTDAGTSTIIYIDFLENDVTDKCLKTNHSAYLCTMTSHPTNPQKWERLFTNVATV